MCALEVSGSAAVIRVKEREERYALEAEWNRVSTPLCRWHRGFFLF